LTAPHLRPTAAGVDRRRFLLTSLAGAFATPLAAKAQQAGRVYTIGLLSSALGPDASGGPLVSALHERGYELGRNLAIERRYAAGKPEQLPHLAADLVRQKVDVIVTLGSSESLAALKATATIPIVFVTPAPVELGLVRNLARPGGNATGLAVDVTPESVGKTLELLKAIVPRLSRLSILRNPDRLAAPIYEKAWRDAGQILRFVDVRGDDDIEAAFATIVAERPEALWITSDPVVVSRRKRITDFAVKQGLPTVAASRVVVQDGGLLSYGANLSVGQGLAAYIDKILKGAKPGDLPVERPTKFELVINLKTAKALGLTIPPSLLLRADQVIE
jgi:putative tryptophan/tyrosine transport system substrate-binding protein